MSIPVIVMYTDGSYNSRTKCGGWASSLYYNDETLHLHGAEYETTNNRMEMMAVIKGLEALNTKCVVYICSDSKYVLDGVSGWMYGWKKKKWRDKQGGKIKNVDLWKQLYELAGKHKLRTSWVKGHSGVIHNEIADSLADTARSELEHTMEVEKRYGTYN